MLEAEAGESEPTYECLHNKRERDGDCKEDRGNHRKNFENVPGKALVLSDVADLRRDSEHEQECAGLEQSDVLVREGGNDEAQGLRENHMPHRSQTRESYRSCGFDLAGVDRLKSGTKDFGLIAARIDGEGDDSYQETLGGVLGEKNDEKRGCKENLHVQRSASDDFNQSIPDSSSNVLGPVPEQRKYDQEPARALALRGALLPLSFLNTHGSHEFGEGDGPRRPQPSNGEADHHPDEERDGRRVHVRQDRVEVERVIADDVGNVKPSASNQQVVDVCDGTNDDDEGERGVEVPPMFPQVPSPVRHVSPQDLAHEAPSPVLFLVLKDLLRGPLCNDLSCVHEENSAHGMACEAHVVLGEHHRVAVADYRVQASLNFADW